MSQKWFKYPPVIRFDHTGDGAPIASCAALTFFAGFGGEDVQLCAGKRRYYVPDPQVDETVWRDRPKRPRSPPTDERSWKSSRATQYRVVRVEVPDVG